MPKLILIGRNNIINQDKEETDIASSADLNEFEVLKFLKNNSQN